MIQLIMGLSAYLVSRNEIHKGLGRLNSHPVGISNFRKSETGRATNFRAPSCPWTAIQAALSGSNVS